MAYNLTPLAKLRLDEIWSYSFHKWGREQADQYLTQLDTHCRRLDDGTLIGKDCSKFVPEIEESLLYYHSGRHYIIYRREESDLQILTILHDQSQKQFEDFLREYPES